MSVDVLSKGRVQSCLVCKQRCFDAQVPKHKWQQKGLYQCYQNTIKMSDSLTDICSNIKDCINQNITIWTKLGLVVGVREWAGVRVFWCFRFWL